MVPSIGVTEILILLTIVLLLFGAKRIPELARGLGSGVKEFREGVSGKDEGRKRVRDRGQDDRLPAAEEHDSSASDDRSAGVEDGERVEQGL